MLDIILERHILYVLMGIFTVVGLLSKIIVSTTLKKLVQAAGNMSKSSHPLMRLVRAKFEHACMVSDKVENVSVFVDKYLYEYRVLGMRIHSLQRVERLASVLCLLSGVTGALAEYILYGMDEEVLRFGGIGAALAIVIFLIQLSTDEKYRLEAARNYMVDYLENVCLHRYEKANQKEQKRKVESLEMAVEVKGASVAEAPEMESEEEKSMSMELAKMKTGAIEPAAMEPVTMEPVAMEPVAMKPVVEVPGADAFQSKSKRQSRKLKKAGKALAAASERAEQERIQAENNMENSLGNNMENDFENGVVNRQFENVSKIEMENAMPTNGQVKEQRKEPENEAVKEAAKDVLIRQILEEYMA